MKAVMPFPNKRSMRDLGLIQNSVSKESLGSENVLISSKYETLESEQGAQPRYENDQVGWQENLEGEGICSQVYFELYDSKQEPPSMMALLDDFKAAISKGEFRIYLQPQVRLTDSKVVGAEALVRWLHPRFGLLAPGAFLPVIEKSGKIGTLSLWLLRECMLLSCAQAEPHKIRISVNLSVQDLESPNFPQQVEILLEQTGAQAAELCMEITESSAMRNPEQCLASMLRLRQLGFALSIDDFGTGYSSLSYLSKMPVDELKIDRSFITQLHDAKQREIVKAIIQLGLILKLRLIAEGVEDSAECELLESLGCHEIQGYLIASPMPALDFFVWLKACSGYCRELFLYPQVTIPSCQIDATAKHRLDSLCERYFKALRRCCLL
ncbi:hypothetical protein CXQ81_27185 [Pseudomonas sp. 09C 129]|uniref:putative bifunctional diguanylate cyclase/phosphodiesterase n=1 Tax=Pseudomonas sp. 09C 129 TaxID=2054915 RepID=UPI000C6D1567|nr:EAL domain-containing protein [Pseudomonas sp. 09C 129]AUG04138.1 hypothetical protein CXQ81_27185 [Pseudomonas sp. 09C 129]